ncbi:MAG: hypothetical protein AAGG01_19670, partial [Planctomycetota bacterium]
PAPRPTARTCVECHRAPETWGLGSGNFRLGRHRAFVADRRGIEAVAFDRENPQVSVPLGKLVLSDVVDLELDSDPLQGHGRTLFAAERDRGVHLIDVSDARSMKRVAFRMTVQPSALDLSGEHLYVADGIGGLKIFNVADPREPRLVGALPTIQALDVEVRWPYAYVADGPGGLIVVDVRYPVAPKVAGGLGVEDFSSTGQGGRGLVDVDVMFQYSRPKVGKDGAPVDERTPARRLVAVCDEEAGPILVDATEPGFMTPIASARSREGAAERRRADRRYTALGLRSHVDVAAPQGGTKTVERDLMYFTELRTLDNGAERTMLRVVDVSDPTRQVQLTDVPLGNRSESLTLGAWYNAPFLRPLAITASDAGIRMVDVTNSAEAVELGSIGGIGSATAFVAEEFPLDAMVDEDRGPLKDVSHPTSRWLLRGEIERTLDVPGTSLGTVGFYAQESIAAASSARAMFARADSDRSGLLTGAELKRVGGARADANGDGRVTLFELAQLGEAPGESVALTDPAMGGEEERELSPEEIRRRDPLVGVDGDLTKLLELVDPFAFEKKKDGRLDAKEFKRAYFAALDLDGDRRLSIHEMSRGLGDVRRLRFGDELAGRSLARLDDSGGGTLTLREFEIRDEDWAALDVNGDGAIQLDWRAMEARTGRGADTPMTEWPTRRRYGYIATYPGASADALLKRFDANGDGVLAKRELRKRPDLFRTLDIDRSTLVEADEVMRAETLSLARGLEMMPDSFLRRWDLDGSGEVEEDEV